MYISVRMYYVKFLHDSILAPKAILVDYMLKLPCIMIITVYICCWMYMVHSRIRLDEFWVKNAKFALQTRRNLPLVNWVCLPNFPIGLWTRMGACSVVRYFFSQCFPTIKPLNIIESLHITSSDS